MLLHSCAPTATRAICRTVLVASSQLTYRADLQVVRPRLTIAVCPLKQPLHSSRRPQPNGLLLSDCDLQGDLLHVLSHPERVLRHTAGSITTTVVGARGLVGWPELVMWICGSLQSGSDAAALDGALDSLIKVVEDHPHEV